MNQVNDRIESPVLESAWQRYAQFDTNARIATKQRKYWLQIVTGLATLVVLLAVFTGSSGILPPAIHYSLHITMVIILIINFLILVYAVRSQQLENSQVLRTAAEEIKKEIYLYRTVMQWHEARDQWLTQRMAAIQRHVADSFGNEITLAPYAGKYTPNDSKGDPCFTRLMPEDYLRYRLDNQLSHYANEMGWVQQTRKYLQLGILAAAGLSMLLAMLGEPFIAWVAVTIFTTAVLINWLGPREFSTTVNTYNQLIASLQNIRDYWYSLTQEERTGGTFFKLVIATEKVIWSQYHKQASDMWQAVDELEGKGSDVLDEVLMLPAASTIFSSSKSQPQEIETETVEAEVVIPEEEEEGTEPEEVEEKTALTVVEDVEIIEPKSKPRTRPKKGLPHAFVVMPFGRKQGAEGRWYDFNSIYYELIKPALEAAGFESFRADEESVSGDILTDMFQELLLADLVIADLSIDNANVFYELGVRHAMRKRGLVHIQSGRAYMPFDIFNVRTIPYQTDKNGRPDPEHLEKDKQTITKIARETWASDIDRVHSPIFNLLDGLHEPERKTLRTPLATGFWREYNEWRERVTVARRQKRIGDILVLTEEIQNPLIKEEAIGEAGRALRGMGRPELALQQYRQGLELNPKNTSFRREEAYHLNSLNRTDEAIVKLERLVQDNPDDTEATSFLGRIYKQMWMETWVGITDKKKRAQEAFEASHWLIKSVHTYMEGYRINQNDYYPGINALTGSVLMDYLAMKYKLEDDPDVEAIRENLPKIKGAIHFALESTTKKNTSDYWALASLAELEVSICEDPVRVTRAYKRALTAARKNIFNLKSSLAQLELLQSLDFRPDYVQAGIEVLRGEINRISYEEESDEKGTQDPPQVFIFSGHMVDRPQPDPPFPAKMENEVREKIKETLDKFNANGNDLGITPGANAGSDIIFLELCLERGMKVEIHLPFEEAMYIKKEISYAGDRWIERFYSLRNNPNVTMRLQSEHIGPVKPGDNVYERNERWALYSALIHGVHRMRLIVLWDGVVDDIPGGPDNMLEEVRQIGGIAEHLNTTKFDYWKAGGKVSKALDLLADL